VDCSSCGRGWLIVAGALLVACTPPSQRMDAGPEEPRDGGAGPVCGDGTCDPGERCAADCGGGPVCGDGTCDPGERCAADCDPPGCGSGELECSGGGCYDASGRCDGDADCADGSDERGCGEPDLGDVEFNIALHLPVESGDGHTYVCLNKDEDLEADDRGNFLRATNLGAAATGGFRAAMGVIDDDTGEVFSCDDLTYEGDGAPGATITWDGPICCDLGEIPAADYRVWAKVDARDAVDESNESNNDATGSTVHFSGGPDLGNVRFSAHYWRPSVSSDGRLHVCLNRRPSGASEDFGDYVRATNEGESGTGSYHTALGVYRPSTDRIYFCRLTSDGTRSGHTSTWDGPYCCDLDRDLVPAGEYKLYVRADIDDEVEETDETNNRAYGSSTFTVTWP